MKTAYTDGACLGNPGPGGWAYFVIGEGGHFRSGAENPSTNQRMEIMAALRAVEDTEGELEIVSDSTYVVNCFKKGWWRAWVTNGWRNASKQPVANRDLWQPLIALVTTSGRPIDFRWVKGHSTDEMNDIVDRLAVEAAKNQQGRTGVGPPGDLGPADMVSAAAPSVVGRRIAVFGPRPTDLDGWSGGPLTEAVKQRLGDVLMAKAQMNDGAVVVTGLDQGAEQLAAEIGLPYVAVLPFPDQDARWPAAAKKRYRDLLDHAAAVIETGTTLPKEKVGFAKAYTARDREILKQADEAIVVSHPSTQRKLKAARDALGEDEVFVIELDELRSHKLPS